MDLNELFFHHQNSAQRLVNHYPTRIDRLRDRMCVTPHPIRYSPTRLAEGSL